MNREDCLALDRADPLAAGRAAFDLPAGVIYLDGNSLGALPRATAARVAEVVKQQWGQGLIRSWNSAGWMELPQRVGDKIGRLIGAAPGETVCADSTSVNLFKVLAVALAIQSRGERVRIVSERDNFPTDLYMAQGLTQLRGAGELHLVDGPAGIAAALDARCAVLMLTHVNYRTGRMHEMERITRAAHAAGALVIWDLAHSAGAVELDLNAAGADFAVGCGYKYLNGGPGAPAFVWVAARHQAGFSQPLSGWLGHAAPFEFDPAYRPAAGVARYLAGTPSVVAMSALEVGVDVVLAAGMSALRAKSVALTELFSALVAERCAGLGLTLVSPSQASQRGSQVCLSHADAYPVMQALIARGVIGDFRAPDVLRFGFAPLYNGFAEAWDAVEALREVLASRHWDAPQFRQRAAVT
ncbi:MAG: kynureninase [Burkholderiaceae bacterium]